MSNLMVSVGPNHFSVEGADPIFDTPTKQAYDAWLRAVSPKPDDAAGAPRIVFTIGPVTEQ